MKRFVASTIIETIVALIIIMIILAISVMVITNMQQSNIEIKAEALSIIKIEFEKIKQEKLFFSDEKRYNNYTVKRYFENSNFGDRLKIIHIEVLDVKMKLLISKKEIILVD